MRSTKLKRSLDILIALFALLLLLPLIALTALLVRLKLGAPVIFRQRRPGLGGRPFIIYKFRTMLNLYDENGRELPAEQRVTTFGRLLRRASLDELPELVNVIKGEMSLVGPRPLRMRYLSRYTPEQYRRHEVKPGITGWAQVNGRNELTWEDRFKLDIWYVDNWNNWLDLKILWLTAISVLKREGVSARGSDSTVMSEFMGSADQCKSMN
ncbi:sugar transferase [Pelotomaculum propionicicum]|uniref:sugar transferase n=1 Tax=Pelotomaculum propionicicum TaxID=258475 RepID=UPI003B829854